jgi:hypothetical protein
MNKQKILELTGLSEDQFYDQYPDQETFCSDYPDACNQLEKAQGGTEITPEMKSNWNAYVQANKANITPDWNRMQTDPTTHEKYYPGNRALEQWNASNPNQAIQSSYIPAIQQAFNDIQGSNSQLGTRMQSSFKNRTGADAYSKKDAIIGTLTGNQLFPIGREETYHNNQLIAQKNYGTNVNASAPQPAYASNTPVVPAMATSYTAPPPVTQPQRARTPFDYDVPQPAPVVRQNTQMTAMNPSMGATTSYAAPPQRMTAKQTMNTVGSTGATSVSSLNAPPSSIPLQNTVAAASSKYTPPVSSISSSKVDPNSVVDAMKSRGMDSSFANRKKLAEEKGITGYTGTASQNTILKNKINTPPPVSKERGGELEKYKTGREALLTTDPRKVQQYTDSLNAYNSKYESLKALNEWNKNPTEKNKKKYWKAQNENYSWLNRFIATNNHQRSVGWTTQNAPDGNPDVFFTFKKPVQPYYLQKEQPVIPAAIYQPQIAPSITDTIMTVLDPGQEWYLNKERDFLYKNKEQGGTAIFPSMRNFKQGGYYGMDQKFHPNSDSGTYVTGAGYYFQPGGQKNGQFQIDPNQQSAPITSDAPPGGQIGAMDLNQGDNQNSQYNYPDQTIPAEQSNQQAEPFSLEGYGSSINPATGFKDWSKDGKVINNIKRDDPNLWNNLAETGHGARWETGQTDFQKVGRTAGKIAQGIQGTIAAGTMTAGMITQQQQRKNMSNSATNLGSTDAKFTNPPIASKGDYDITSSGYGQFKPNQMGNLSFKGMYGKYGMQVPKYAVGGFDPELNVIDDSYIPQVNETSELDLSSLYTLPNVQRDNTRVAPPIIPVNVREKEISYSNSKASPLPNPSGKDVATRLNNPGNIIYTPTFAKMFGAVDSGVKQTDGTGHFAAFRTIEDGLKARETQLFGTVDGIFQSRYYKPNTDINYALKKWSGGVNKDGSINSKGYGVNIYPEIAGKTLAEITPQERRELMKRQIKQESGSMYKYLKSNNYFKYGGQQQGGQVVEMDENQIQQFLAAGGQLEFLD